MPIKMKVIGPNVYPRIICDFCNQPIEDSGNAVWGIEEDSDVIFTHKRCDRAYRRNRPAGTELWMELRQFLNFLTVNTIKGAVLHDDD
jgi:hypothetical protein